MTTDLVTQLCIEKMEYADCLFALDDLSNARQINFINAVRRSDTKAIGNIVLSAIDVTAYRTFSHEIAQQIAGGD